MRPALALLFAIFTLPLFAANASSLREFVYESLRSERGFELLLKEGLIPERPLPIRSASSQSSVFPLTRQLFERVELGVGEKDQMRLVVRYPAAKKTLTPRPVLLVMSGLFKNVETLQMFGDVGDVILVGLEYPVVAQSSLRMMEEVAKSLPKVPVQVASALAWIQQQSWADPERVSLVGISFGAVMAPLSQRVAEFQGLRFHSTVYAYGGGALENLLDYELRDRMGERELKIVKEVASIALAFVEPTVHLPELLPHPYLFINGEEDEVFPMASVTAMHEARAEDGEVIWLPGGHINSERWEIIGQVIDVSGRWLREQGAID